MLVASIITENRVSSFMKKWLNSILIALCFMGGIVYIVFFSGEASMDNRVVMGKPNGTDSIITDSISSEESASIDLQPAIYVTIDNIPSIELVLNQQGHVISYHGYNFEGQIVADTLKLSSMPINQAFQAIYDQFDSFLFMQQKKDIVFTFYVPTTFIQGEQGMTPIRQTITDAKEQIQQVFGQQIEPVALHIWDIDENVWKQAREQKQSAGKIAMESNSSQVISGSETGGQGVKQAEKPVTSTAQEDMIKPSLPDTPKPEAPKVPSIIIPKVGDIPGVQDVQKIE